MLNFKLKPPVGEYQLKTLVTVLRRLHLTYVHEPFLWKVGSKSRVTENPQLPVSSPLS